jgi:hypothetical protein
LVVAAGAFALVVSFVGCCALPGAAGVLLPDVLLVEAALWSVLLGAVVLLAVAFWSVLLVLLAAAFWSVLLLPVAPAWLLVHESEIMLTELTWTEPSLARVPWIWTSCPSCGFSTELSPCRLTVWPLSAERTQLPPDCFRQPRSEFWSLLEFVLVAEVFWPLVSVFTVAPLAAPGWSMVLPCVPGAEVPCPCPAAPLFCPAWPCVPWLPAWPLLPAPPAPPACANAIPDASISARKNFLFISFAPSEVRPSGLSDFFAGVR